MTWNTGSLGALTRYQSDNPGDANWGSKVDTALYVMAPPTGTATVNNDAGSAMALSGSTIPMDRSATNVTQTALIFRGNPNGTANAGYGSCLWLWRYNNGALGEQRLITDQLSSAWNAVVFTRTANSKRSVILKIVCGSQNYPNTEQTSESTDGKSKVTLLSGRTVYMSNSALSNTTTYTFPSGSNLLPQPNNATPTPAPTPTPTPVPTPTPTPTPVPTPVPTATPVPTPTPVPTATPVATPTPVPTPTPTPKPPTPTPKPATPTPVPTPTPTPTPKPTPVPIG